MKKFSVLLAVFIGMALVGCSGATRPTALPTVQPTPEVTPTVAPAPTVPANEMPSSQPSAPATCTLEPIQFPVNSAIPPVTSSDHIHGPVNASITVIEYADFQCPGCAAMASLRGYLESIYGEDVRVIYRHFPLSFHTKATITAEAAEAAGAQGKFFEMHDLLYARQQEWSQLSDAALEERLVEYARELGLDTERFAQELRGHVHLAKVQSQQEEAINARLGGTPSYIINGVEYPSEIGLGYAQIAGFIRLLQELPRQYQQVPPPVTRPDARYTATIETSKGKIVLELFADQAPTNVNNFAFLAEEGWYDGKAFFFVDPAVAAYAGDPTNMGWGLPFVGYVCGDEIRSGLTFDQPGMVAFYTPKPGRNSSLFFITTAARPDFNGRFTIIGRVTEGLEVVKSLTPTRPGGPDPDTIKTIRIQEQ